MAINLSLLVHQMNHVHLCNNFLYMQDSMNYQWLKNVWVIEGLSADVVNSGINEKDV